MSTSQQLRLVGMSRSLAKHRTAVLSARLQAAIICAAQGSCTIEDVYESGIPAEKLGNAAGSIFTRENFKFVGYEKAKRPSSHARVLGRWRLRG